jgi:preprotein translocase subunit YajC
MGNLFYILILGGRDLMGHFLTALLLLTADVGEAPEAGGMNSMITLVGYVAFFGVIMYFMLYRPQKKRDAKAKELMSSLQVGMKVTTVSGVVGKIINIKDDVVTIETSIERTQLDILKWAIKDVEKPIEA